MIVLAIPATRDADRGDATGVAGHHLVLVFGVGMIGQAIVESCLGLGFTAHSRVDYPWHDPDRRRSAAAALADLVCGPRGRTAPERLSIVWSAGQAGFRSGAAETRSEHGVFLETLGLVDQLRGSLPAVPLDFHYLSSAGGLFEGQQSVTPDSRPAPLRPYGEMKLEQEELLLRRFPAGTVFIYRPSSAYGSHSRNQAHGLINHLVRNVRCGRVTVLDARQMALRDYVYAGDIGRYIARGIRFGGAVPDPSAVRFLVSARCASIFEVVNRIERVLKLRIPVRYDEHFGNHRHITFSPHVLPAGWRPAPLEVGIRQFLVHPGGNTQSFWARNRNPATTKISAP